MKKFVGAILVLTAVCSIALAQEVVPVQTEKTEVDKTIANEVIVDLPTTQARFRPKISLQVAMKKMEEYIKDNKIDVSKYYLAGVSSFMYGGEDQKKIAVWQFGWMNERFAVGDYVTILVSQDDGGVWQIPSM